MIKYAIFENLDKAKSILKSKEIPLNDPSFMDIKKKLEKANRLGYIGWIIGLLYDKNQDKQSVLGIVETISQPHFKETSTWFTKPITDIESGEEFTDQLNRARNRKLAKNMWLKFPSIQKNILDWENPEIESLLVRLWDAQYDNLIKKISKYKTYSDLLKQIGDILSGTLEDNFDYFIDLCYKYNIEILYKSEENNIIITEVRNSSEVRILAQDSSWCIRGDSYFRSYMIPEDFYGIKIPKTQIVIINTDEIGNYRKIGVTMGTQITTAHLWNDTQISGYNVIGYVKKKGFDIESLYINSKTAISIDSLKSNLYHKIDFKIFKLIVDKFELEIDRLECWNYIKPNGAVEFYTKEELKILSKNILFLKKISEYKGELFYFWPPINYMDREDNYQRQERIDMNNSRYLLSIFADGYNKIKNENIEVSGKVDKFELLLTYFDKKQINLMSGDGYLLKIEHAVYSKYELCKKYGFVPKRKLLPSLGDVVYLSEKEIKKYAGFIEEDIYTNLFTYHEVGYENIKECLDVFYKYVPYNEIFSKIRIPEDKSRIEIFDKYFSDRETDEKYKFSYNNFDLLRIPIQSIRENTNLFKDINVYVDKYAKEVLKRISENFEIEEFLAFIEKKVRILQDDVDDYLPGFFEDILDYRINNVRYHFHKIGLKTLMRISKEKLKEVIESGAFRISIDTNVSNRIIDIGIDPKICLDNKAAFEQDIKLFEIFYTKKNYGIFSKVISEWCNERNKPDILMFECYLLNYLDSNVDKYNLESAVDKYLDKGADNDIKVKITPIRDDIKYGRRTRILSNDKKLLLDTCDFFLEDKDKAKKYWSSIVLSIVRSIHDPNQRPLRYGSTDYVTREFATEQVNRFRELITDKINRDIFDRSKNNDIIWGIIKNGVTFDCYNYTMDAYSFSKCLLEKDVVLKIEMLYGVYKKIIYEKNIDKNINLPNTLQDCFGYLFDNMGDDEYLDFIESKPNDRLNKKVKNYFMQQILHKKRRDFSERIVNLAKSLLNQRERVFFDLEIRPQKTK